MKASEKLRKTLNKHFKWNKARITCFSNMLIGLFMTRTVNLTSLACAFSGKAKRLSRYRRIQRFFSLFQVDYGMIAKFIFGLFDFKGGVYLTLDRTNWKWGKKNINILMLAIVYKGMAIPIFWSLLDKYGNSGTDERIRLIQSFVNCFGKDCIKGILADREFKGGAWFNWLIQENIPFYIRINSNGITTNSKGQEVGVDGLFYDLKPKECRVLEGKRKLWGVKIYLTATRSVNGELVIIATNGNSEEALEIYYKRWEIENLFQCLKGRGFNFEDTHITDLVRIKKLIVLLAIAFCWAHKTGEWYHEEVEAIKMKRHGRPAYSLFRYGLDVIRDAMFSGVHQIFSLIKRLTRKSSRYKKMSCTEKKSNYLLTSFLR